MVSMCVWGGGRGAGGVHQHEQQKAVDGRPVEAPVHVLGRLLIIVVIIIVVIIIIITIVVVIIVVVIMMMVHIAQRKRLQAADFSHPDKRIQMNEKGEKE